MAVDTESKLYKKYHPVWTKTRIAIAGEEAVKAANTRYLPLPIGCRSDKDLWYQGILCRAYWFAASGETAKSYQGQIFRKKPILEGVEENEELLKDIDGNGNDLFTFTTGKTWDQIKVSYGAILVDHDNTNGKTLTVAQAKELGIRPKLVYYPAESIIWAEKDFIKLKEIYQEKVDEFTIENKKQIKVLDILNGEYRQRIYREVKNDSKQETEWVQFGSDVFPKMAGGKPLNFIPMQFIGGKDNDMKPDDPMLLGIVNANFQHYGLYSDFREGLHWIRPFPYITGHQPADKEKEIIVRSDIWHTSRNPDTKFGILEFNGSGLKFDVDALNKLEAHMVAMGSHILEKQKSSAESGDKARIDKSIESSILATLANNISDALTISLRILFEWAGNPKPDLTYKLNTDYNAEKMNPQLMTAINGSVAAMTMSKKTAMENFQESEMYKDGKTVEEEQAQIMAESAGLDNFENLADMINNIVDSKINNQENQDDME